MHTLTETERATVYNGLRVAAEQYRKDAITVKNKGNTALEHQFYEQANAADRLANQFENCEEIRIKL